MSCPIRAGLMAAGVIKPPPASTPRCFYDVLEVSKGCTDDDVKHAYRKLAIKYHPDKNPGGKEDAERKFQEISEAYAVLSDKVKRDIYDHFGRSPLNAGGVFNCKDAAEKIASYFSCKTKSRDEVIFKAGDFLRNAASMANGFGSSGKEQSEKSKGGSEKGEKGSSENLGKRKKPQPSMHELWLSYEELYSGCTKRMKVTRARYPTGSSTPIKDSKILTIDVQPGWKQGTKVTFECEGDHQCPREDPADVVFVVHEKPHPLFIRHDRDLTCRLKISLLECFNGVDRVITSLDGRPLRVCTEGGCAKPESDFIIPGEGMPTAGGSRGDLVVTFDVDFPNRLTDEQKRGVEEMLSALNIQ